jgi:hypothetical protein
VTFFLHLCQNPQKSGSIVGLCIKFDVGKGSTYKRYIPYIYIPCNEKRTSLFKHEQFSAEINVLKVASCFMCCRKDANTVRAAGISSAASQQ